MSSESGFRTPFMVVWLRLVTLGVVALVFAEALWLAPGKAQGWSFYLTNTEVFFELAVRFVTAAVFGMLLGTVLAAVAGLFLWFFKNSRSFVVDSATKVAVVVVVFLLSRYALEVLIKWSYGIAIHRALYDKLLLGGQFAVFALALCFPRSRRAVVTSLDTFLTPKMTRRTAVTTVAGAAVLAVTEFAISKTVPTTRTMLSPQRPKPNFILVTFDALSADDMSLYGYRLPTTPNIEAFARKSTVFKHYFSGSTFTTPSVATMMTGKYPSETLIYQLQGQLRSSETSSSLPNLMRAAGYVTSAFMSNPYAYYFTKGLKNEFDFLPEPLFQERGLQRLWDATTPLHQDTRYGSRIDEYWDMQLAWNSLVRMPTDQIMRFRSAETFAHARQTLSALPDGLFLWVHVMSPHDPYIPDEQDRGRFIPDNERQAFVDESGSKWRPHYPPDQQSQVDRRRLAYDEFIATADRDFGAFVSELESSGKLQNTTVIVSADHGESFEGGVYQHRVASLTRPVIHVPMIIRTPGQQDGYTTNYAADQTALAPTILDLAGQPKPDWMRGPSLVPWLSRNAGGEGEGLAFTQYMEKNSVFRPLRHGTVGVIDGKSLYQYVLDIETQRGMLRPLSEAQYWNRDRSAENPELADQLRSTISARFPELVQRPT